jgi:hypothetical protein
MASPSQTLDQLALPSSLFESFALNKPSSCASADQSRSGDRVGPPLTQMILPRYNLGKQGETKEHIGSGTAE